MDRPLQLLVPVGALLFSYFGLVGAAQLPPTALQYLIATWLMPAAVLLWARADALTHRRHVPGLGGGIWFLLFGPLLVWYYLLRTYRERHWGISVLLATLLLTPFLGALAGSVAAWAAPLPPRYVQLARGSPFLRVTPQLASTVAQQDFERIAAFLSEEHAAGRSFPADVAELYDRWQARRTDQPIPFDLFTGLGYYYEPRDSGYVLWSAGPDRSIGTDDDLWFAWPPPAPPS